MYESVDALSVAVLVYNAILKTCVVPVLKLKMPLGIPVLNVLVTQLPVKAITGLRYSALMEAYGTDHYGTRRYAPFRLRDV